MKRKKLFQFTVPELKAQLDQALSIDDSSNYAIDKALKEHSRLHNEWSVMAATAQKILHTAELDLKRVTAEVIRDIRKDAVKEGKALAQTYPVEKELVPLDERWQAQNLKVIDLKEYVDILSGVERRFQNRGWILIQLAKGREGAFEPTVKGRKRGSSKPLDLEETEF